MHKPQQPEPIADFEADDLQEDLEQAVELWARDNGRTFHRTGHSVEVFRPVSEQ